MESMQNRSKELLFSESDVELHFSIIDHLMFGLLLGLSTLIGIYYGFISKHKQDNTKEYLLGGKTMSSIPISASLIASNVSGIALLGIPSEIYANGTQLWMFILPTILIAIPMIKIFLPIFHELKVTSSFEYLDKRFNQTVRMLASSLYTISCLIYIPIVIYVPALALGQVTGLNIHVITAALCVVCIFYTTIGGLRAVVWTDTLQFVLMIGAILAVIYKGLESVGGFCNVWSSAEAGGRLIFFNMNPSPFERTSFWTVTFGMSAIWLANIGVNQSYVQRFLAVPDIKLAKRSVWIFSFGLIVIKSCSCFTGLLMYAKYEDCDPVTTGKIKKLDQILPYYVMDVAGSIPGLPGLFIAGIFAAALSTMSSSLNTLSGTIFEDFIRHRIPDVTEVKASNTMKIIAIILGVIIVLLVLLIEKMGAVFYLALALIGVTGGTLLGIFLIGMLFRRVNTTGIISGAVVSFLFMITILIGAQLSAKQKQILLPLRTDGCSTNVSNIFNTPTTTIQPLLDEEAPYIFPLFKISFMYYGLVGTIMVLLVAYPVSILTGGNADIDETLLAPFLRSKEYKKRKQEHVYKLIEMKSANYLLRPNGDKEKQISV